MDLLRDFEKEDRSVSNVRLLKDIQTRYVYEFNIKDIQRYKLSKEELILPFRLAQERKSLLRDLKNQTLYKIPNSILDQHSVPDEKLGYLLGRLGITGISKRFRDSNS